MSEHQFVAFRAVDGPVTEEDLEFMHEQSSRAEITPWSFDNEYHFGDFRGNATEMLRRGYDVHLRYANFGIRKLMIRLPNGLPDAKAAQPYFDDESLTFLKDQRGPGGILCIEPVLEPGALDDLWDIDPLLERLLPLRAELLDGDLRPLYLAKLAIACDSNHDPEEEREGPVPAGLDELTDAQRALVEFYGLDEALIAAAARNSPALPSRSESKNAHAARLERQPAAQKNAWLAQLLADPRANVRREILAEFQNSQRAPSWPTVHHDRTVHKLQAAAGEIGHATAKERAEQAARERAKKLATMTADPTRILRETEQLVKERSGDAYQQVAVLLADLREALAGSKESDLAEKQARKLKAGNPTLKLLTSELRRKGFLTT